MGELSRMKKYEDLRNQLQEVEDNISTKELSRFEKRLNDLDANNFSMSNQVLNDTHSAQHAKTRIENLAKKSVRPSLESYTINDNSSIYDEYINEVKQYNLEHGNAVSSNTNVNVLNQIRNEMSKQNTSKPYFSNYDRNDKNNNYVDNYDTNDYVPINTEHSNTEQIPLPSLESPFEDSQTMSKDDIMAEVQSLVNGSMKDSYSPMGTDTFQKHITADRNAQQQLLNETTQMRAQLDDYEDNLSEVNGKVHEVLRLSNIILTVFIVFLVFALICLIYLVILSRGV